MSARLYLANAGRTQVREAAASFLSLSFDAGLYVVERGESVAVPVTLARENVTDDVTLSVAGLPAGTTGSFSPAVLASEVLVSTLTLTASGGADLVNLQNVTVSASTALGVATSRSFTLTVESQPVAPGALFVLSTDKLGMNVVRGGSATAQLSVVRAVGYTTTITPAIVGALPVGVSASFSPSTFSNGTVTTTVTFSALADATPSAVDIEFEGTGAGSIANRTAFRLRVIGTEQYAHLESPYDPPRNAAGTPMVFNASTGLYEGTVYDTSFLTRQWLIDTADTIVTIKPSGGDYGPLQLETAFVDAAARGDRTVIVADTGMTVDRPSTQLAGIRLKTKNTTYESAEWTVVVSSDFFDGTWTPTGERFADIRPAANGGLEEQQHMFYVQSGPQIDGVTPSNASGHVIERDATLVYKYAFIGAYFRPTPTRTRFMNNAAVLNLGSTNQDTTNFQGFITKWSVVDGDYRHNTATGIGRRFSRCVLIAGRDLAFENSLIMRNGNSGGENNCFTQVRGRRTKLKNCFIEGQSINVLLGGGDPGSPEERLQDVEVQRNYLCKSDMFNRASPRYGLNTWTGWQETNSANAPTINTYSSVKACFQIKFAQRALVIGNVVENTFPNAVNGVGILLEVAGQTGQVINGRSDNHIVMHNLVVRSNSPFSMIPHYQANLGIPPLFGVSVRNNVFMRSVYAHRARLQEDLWFPGWSAVPGLSAAYPDVTALMYGLYDIKHNTFMVPPQAGEGNLNGWQQMRMPALDQASSVSVRLQFEITDNILPNRWITSTSNDRGIKQGGNPLDPSLVDFPLLAASAITPGAATMARNAIPLGIPRMTRAASQGLFPDQYEPAALWQDMNDNPWGWKEVSADPWACDLELEATSPIKGLGENGRDPGVDWPLLMSVVSGVRPYDPAQLGVGITVDFS